MSVVFCANMAGKAKLLQHCIQVLGEGIMQKSAIEDDISDEAYDDRDVGKLQVLKSQEHPQRQML